MSDTYDLVIIGAGPGGYIAAFRAGQLGLKTLCIEKRKTLGGTCLNVGCIPSKALLESSHHYANLKKLAKHGIEVGDATINVAAMLKRKDAVVRQLTNGIGSLMKKNKVDVMEGTARVTSPGAVEVTTPEGVKTIATKRILLATGSEPTPLPFLPFDGQKVISSTEALSLPEVPKRLLVVGGGVIGVELGSVWARLGAKVTIVEFFDRLVPGMDKELSSEFKKILLKQGFDLKLSTKVTGANTGGEGVTLDLEDAKGEKSQVSGDVVLVSIGRRPYSAGLGLAELGVKQDKAGRVEVDSDFQTSVKGVYAVGDLIAGPMLAHKAEEEGVACVERMAGQKTHIMYEAIPGIVYTWPELAGVGITEDDAKEKGLAVKVGKVPFMANGRAKCADESDGFVKVIADAKTDRVLGVHMIGPQVSELISEAVTVMEFGGSAEDIGRIVHAHPTLSETLKEAALAVDKRSLNF
jgi:dihydrolipoamide dehydrogenase